MLKDYSMQILFITLFLFYTVLTNNYELQNYTKWLFAFLKIEMEIYFWCLTCHTHISHMTLFFYYITCYYITTVFQQTQYTGQSVLNTLILFPTQKGYFSTTLISTQNWNLGLGWDRRVTIWKHFALNLPGQILIINTEDVNDLLCDTIHQN